MKQSTFDTLKKIQSRVMAKFGDGLLIKKRAYDKVEFVMEKAIEDKETDPILREQLQNYLATGQLDKETYEIDPDKERKFNEALELEIRTAIRKGELPHPNKDPLFKRIRGKRKK